MSISINRRISRMRTRLIGMSESPDEPMYLPDQSLDKATDMLVMIAPQGAGKTHQVQRLMNSLPPNSRILYISARRTLTADLSQRLGLTSYETIRPKKRMRDGTLKGIGICDVPKLIIQYESLNRIISASKYDLVIVDECETILQSCCLSPFNKANLLANKAAFEGHVNAANNLVIMDSDMTDRTIKMMKSLRYITNSVQYAISVIVPNPLHFMFYRHEVSFINQLRDDLAAKRKIAFVSTSLTYLKNVIFDVFAEFGLEEHPSDLTKQQLLVYTSETINDSRDSLINIQQTWKSAPSIIFSPSITVGVSYDGKADFDNIYLFVSPLSVGTETVQQMISRVRWPKSNLIRVFVADPPCPPVLDDKVYGSEREFQEYVVRRVTTREKVVLAYIPPESDDEENPNADWLVNQLVSMLSKRIVGRSQIEYDYNNWLFKTYIYNSIRRFNQGYTRDKFTQSLKSHFRDSGHLVLSDNEMEPNDESVAKLSLDKKKTKEVNDYVCITQFNSALIVPPDLLDEMLAQDNIMCPLNGRYTRKKTWFCMHFDLTKVPVYLTRCNHEACHHQCKQSRIFCLVDGFDPGTESYKMPLDKIACPVKRDLSRWQDGVDEQTPTCIGYKMAESSAGLHVLPPLPIPEDPDEPVISGAFYLAALNARLLPKLYNYRAFVTNTVRPPQSDINPVQLDKDYYIKQTALIALVQLAGFQSPLDLQTTVSSDDMSQNIVAMEQCYQTLVTQDMAYKETRRTKTDRVSRVKSMLNDVLSSMLGYQLKAVEKTQRRSGPDRGRRQRSYRIFSPPVYRSMTLADVYNRYHFVGQGRCMPFLEYYPQLYPPLDELVELTYKDRQLLDEYFDEASEIL